MRYGGAFMSGGDAALGSYAAEVETPTEAVGRIIFSQAPSFTGES